jgi:ADP-ribose pyrophosphatase YjhB (NUDIX family)
MASDNRKPLVVLHSDGNAVDFLVAGHIKYGETPEQALLREMKEEMIDQIETYHFVGIVEPLADEWQVFVYHTYNVWRSDNDYVRPERSRGCVVRLENTMYTRTTIPRVLLMCVMAGLTDYDANILHVANLKKQCRNKQRWTALGKEKLSEYFRYHVNSGNPVVVLGEEVNDGDFIKCHGPRIDFRKPSRVGLFSGGTKVGEGTHVQDNIYKAAIVGQQYTTRIWCGREDEELVMPVTRQCAKYLTQYFKWTEERIFDYLILCEGVVHVSDLHRMGCREGVKISSLIETQRKSMMVKPSESKQYHRKKSSDTRKEFCQEIAPGVVKLGSNLESEDGQLKESFERNETEGVGPPKIRFKHDSQMKSGRKPLKKIVYEEKVDERGGVFDRKMDFDI